MQDQFRVEERGLGTNPWFKKPLSTFEVTKNEKAQYVDKGKSLKSTISCGLEADQKLSADNLK